MLEVVFGDSAAGSMEFAMHHIETVIGSASFVVPLGGTLTQEQIQNAERREAQNWANALLLESSRADLISLPLLLSIGAIDGTGIDANRQAALHQVYQCFPEAAKIESAFLETAQKNLSLLLERAGNGEAIRVWSSNNPDEMCGTYWLMAQLCAHGLEHLTVTQVSLPAFLERPDGTVVQYTSWGEMEPYLFGHMVQMGKPLPINQIRAMAQRWHQLQQENAPLRAVLNGQLVSAPETLYDSFIRREIDAQAVEFQQAIVVGSVLGKYQLGISDCWIALRMEHFIRDGLLEAVTQPEPDSPVYRRILRKCSI